MTVRVQTEDFDLGIEVDLLRKSRLNIGAVVSFVGYVRDLDNKEHVLKMTLEHYPGMTERSLEAIILQAKQQWNIIDTTIIHRVGALTASEQIVMVAVAGAHRGEAFKACEFIMDYLKTDAPFWKKELTDAGEHWVEAKVTDDDARARWAK